MFDENVDRNQNILGFWRYHGKTFLFRKCNELYLLGNHQIIHKKSLLYRSYSDNLSIEFGKLLTKDDFLHFL
jgi:hypothetical protein